MVFMFSENTFYNTDIENHNKYDNSVSGSTGRHDLSGCLRLTFRTCFHNNRLFLFSEQRSNRP